MNVADAARRERSGERLAIELRLWRERGTVRTSARLVIACASSNAMNASAVRVEWPTV
jgi:hypothetical protein